MTNTSKFQFITVLHQAGQQLLSNGTRHAPARSATVRIHCMRDAVCLEAYDNSRFFQADRILSFNTSTRLGLLGMRERVEMVDGAFAIESARGKGTAVRAEISFRSNRWGKRV